MVVMDGDGYDNGGDGGSHGDERPSTEVMEENIRVLRKTIIFYRFSPG